MDAKQDDTNQGFEIRPLTRADAAAFRALRLQGLQEHPLAFTAAFEEEAARTLEQVAERMPDGSGADAIFGAFAGGELMGCAGFRRQPYLKWRHKGMMWGVYVRPGLRGRGAGRALVDAVISHARAWVEVLQCAVLPANAPARAAYLGAGFMPYGVEPRCLRWDGVDYDEELLWMPLDQPSASLPGGGISDRRAP